MNSALLLSYGKHITQKDDLLTTIEPQQVFEAIKQPEESVKSQIERLRLVKTIDKNQYGLLKRQLPYWVCGIFNPPYRRIENFGYAECFIVDIDHITEKGLDINSLRTKFTTDSRTMLCFVSPGEDGLKIMFRLNERCSDAGRYSLFYKTFIQILAQQYGFEQVVDKTTSDVSRACFTSYDPDIFFNPGADTVNMKDFVDFDNPFETKVLEHQLKKEDDERKKNRPKENEQPKGPDEDAFAFIRERLNAKKNAVRNKPQVYVPEQLNQILEKLQAYIAEVGVTVEEIVDIQYGKKFKFRSGLSQAEVNLFFGKKGFSVVKSPRQGTSEQLNELMTTYIQLFIADYIMLKDNIESSFFHNSLNKPVSDSQLIRQQVQMLFSDKNFKEALSLCQALWEGYPENCDKWDAWRYAYCLKQLKDYQKALDFCREVYPKYGDFDNIKSVYAWSIYYSEINREKIENEDTFFRAGQGILRLSVQNDIYSPYTLTVFKVLDYLSEKSVYPANKILEWTNKLNPAHLDTKAFAFTDKTGNNREIASQKEQYYMYRSRALLEKGDFEECIRLCKEALSAFDRLHYGNDIWFEWRIALCYEGLGKLDEALQRMNALLLRKNEWFIQKEIAQIYLKQEKYEQSLQYAVDSALCFGDMNKKLRLFRMMTDLLFKLNKPNEAKLHLEYIYRLRQANAYPPDQELLQVISKLKINISPEITMKEFERRITQVWNELKYGNKIRYSGKIKSLLPNGKAGFVESKNGKSYYFKTNQFKGKPKPGLRVSFYLEEGFDVKKNRKTMNAVNILKDE
jgi:tetratricopeptide (TPR) repeat protein